MLNNVKSDPLDVLLFTIGLRLSYLAKSGDSKFKSLLENRNFSIQLGSDTEQVYRTFSVNNGYFTQVADKLDEPNLTITFKDSMTGVKLLTKGDATAFMVGIQNGDLKMAGDYSLLMWFNQVAKFIVPKMPEKLQPVVEQAKPLLTKATPFAKELLAKVNDFFVDKKPQDKKTEPDEQAFDKPTTVTVVETPKLEDDNIKHTPENQASDDNLDENHATQEFVQTAEETHSITDEKVASVEQDSNVNAQNGVTRPL